MPVNGLETESKDDEEEVAEEQKEESKASFCEIQWQQRTSDSRKFTKKNFKRLDDTTNKINLSITKIDEEVDDGKIMYIPLSSPPKSTTIKDQNNARIDSNISAYFNNSFKNANSARQFESNDLNISTRSMHPLDQSTANIMAENGKSPQHSADYTDNVSSGRKHSNIISLKSLSLSLRMLKGRHKCSAENLEYEHGDDRKKSLLKGDIFEMNLKKVSTSHKSEGEFQTYAEYTEQNQHQQLAQRRKSHAVFKNQKIYARRSSMSDIASSSEYNKKDGKDSKDGKEKDGKDKTKPKTTELLKKARERNTSENTIKRGGNPNRRISTAY